MDGTEARARRAPSKRRAAVALLACAACAWGAGGEGADDGAAEPPHYHYFAQKRPLVLDPTRVAVLEAPGGAAAGTIERLRAAGVEPLEAEGWPIRPWTVVRTPAVDERAIRDAAAALADRSLGAFVSPVFVDGCGGPMWPTRKVIVGFREGADSREADELLAAWAPGEIVERDFGGMPGVVRVRLDAADGFAVLAAANALAAHPDVAFAEPDMVFTGRGGIYPDDDLFNDQWGLNNFGQFFGLIDFDIDAPEAWDISAGDAAIVVGIIDTGVDSAHADLNLATGTDVTTSPSAGGNPGNTFDNHGTAVAGCATALFDNVAGVAGAAPLCRSASIRTFIATNGTGSWTSQASWTVNALEWARVNGVRVTCNSNGYGFTSSTIATKYSSTRAAGITHFAAAMNDGVATIAYPASLSTVNAVGAADRFGARSSFSNYGTGLAFMAPGSSIWTTDRTGAPGYVPGEFVALNGTSFATPIAAGVAALLLSVDPLLEPADVEAALFATCTDMGLAGYDTEYGWGLINARAALELVLPPPACPADLNGDGVVDSADLGGLIGSWGAGGPFGDINGDGVVSTPDLGILIGKFGQTCPD